MTSALPSSLATTAAAMLCWPTRPAAQRLRRLIDPPPRGRPTWQSLTRCVPGPPVLIATAALLTLLLVGTGVAIAVAVGGATARVLWRSHHRVTEQLSSAEAMADAVHGLVTELRSGAHPVVAAESAAKDAREPARAVLTAISATARLGGDLAAPLRGFAAENPALAPSLRPLIHAWALAQRHGLPLAEVLDAVRGDVAGRVRFAHRVRARMAGPKASGTVLAALPLLGVALGEGMGAHPTQVLLTTPLGQTLLAAGTTLICAGLYWITHLTTKAVLS
jgi:tight adherence protein B